MKPAAKRVIDTITEGTGITARTIELQPFTREAVPTFTQAMGDGGFDARIAAIEAWAAPIDAARKARGDEVNGLDTPEGYAQRLVQLIGAVRRFIAEGDASRAARFAVDLGIVFDEMLMKAEWEHPALVGVGRRESAASAAATKSEDRLMRAALVAVLWNESGTQSRNHRRRVFLVREQTGVGERTLDDYLAEARAHGLIVK